MEKSKSDSTIKKNSSKTNNATKTKTRKTNTKHVKRKVTVDDIKKSIKDLEVIEKLMNDLNKNDIDLYTKQNTAISAVPLKLSVMPADIRKDVLNYFAQALSNRKDNLTKIITGE